MSPSRCCLLPFVLWTIGFALPVAAVADDAVPLPQGARMRLGSPRIVHGLRIGAVAISADGKFIATGGDAQFGDGDSSVRLWDAASRKLLYQLPGHQRSVSALAFAPDGKLLATAGQDNLVSLYDTAGGKLVHQLKGHTLTASCVAFSADGKLLASGSWDKTVRLWDVAAGEERHVLEGHTNYVYTVAIAPDGRRVASGGLDGTVRLWDASTGKETHCLQRHRHSVTTLAFAPDGKTLASGSIDGTARLWDPATGQELRQFAEPADGPDYVDRCALVAFSADGKTLITSWNEGALLRLWDPASGKEIRQTLLVRYGQFVVAYHAANHTLLLGSRYPSDGMVRSFDLDTLKEHDLPGHRREVLSAAWSPDGKLLATGSADKTIRLWDTTTGREIRCLKGHIGRVKCLTFSADGGTLASASDADPTISLWDVASGREIRLLRGQLYGIRELVLSPDGKTLAAAGQDQTCRVWETATGKEVHQFRIVNGFSFAFSADGKLLATAVYNSPIKLFEVATGKEVRTLGPLQQQGVTALAFSPDSRLLAVETQQRVLMLLDVAGGKLVRQFSEPDPTRRTYLVPCNLAFSPDGITLAVAAGARSNPSIRLWEVATGKLRHQFTGHQSDVLALAFTPDGKTLASASADATALLWDVYGPARDTPAELPAPQLAALEADLARPEADRAFQAACSLLAASKQAVPLLREKLQAVPVPDAKRLERLIDDLDGVEFTVRKKASDELEKLGELAEPILQQTLNGQPSLEVKQRVEQLLQRLQGQTLTAEQVRMVRIMEVLERIGTAEARAALAAMAQGAPGARLTRDAGAALQRLGRRPPQP